MRIERALIAVSNKDGLEELAQGLVSMGIEIVSTGNTYKQITGAGIKATYISEVTGFPEILDGRVKTLHPAVHAGILADMGNPEHVAEIERLGIKPFQLVVVNLYPFEQVTSQPDVSLADAIENIDIGGPTLIRAAAKNYENVAVVVSPDDYENVLAELRANDGSVSRELRERLAVKAFEHTMSYDSAISAFLRRHLSAGVEEEVLPESVHLVLHRARQLRYGENPHQKAAVYRAQGASDPLSLLDAEQLQGKELSYNNINDASAALDAVVEFQEPCAVALKHANPCGVGVAEDINEAFAKAYEGDPVSIFGGIVAFNRPVEADLAERLVEIYLEVLMAPSYTEDALQVLATKKNLRVLRIPPLEGAADNATSWLLRTVRGGYLLQEPDREDLDEQALKVVTSKEPTESEWRDLRFGWRVVKHVKSNAIVVAKDNGTLGVGAGQLNRITAARLALDGAGDKAQGAVLASDAFFPFRDVVDAAAEAGISAIIQPGGSIRDQESIEAAEEAGIAMVFTGIRHFRH